MGRPSPKKTQEYGVEFKARDWSVNESPSNHRAKPPSAIDAFRGRA